MGLKGFRIGGAEISRVHANFIINVNNARSEDIVGLIKFVKNKVFSECGCLLRAEVRFVFIDGSTKPVDEI